MPLPKPRIWIVYNRDLIEDLELFKDLVRALYTYSKEDIETIRILNPNTNEEYDVLYFLINVVPNPNIYAIDAYAVPEDLETSIVLRSRAHLAVDFNICLKYKNATVYCNKPIGTGFKPTTSLTYPYFIASEEQLIYRGYIFAGYGYLLYITGLASAYITAIEDDRVAMVINLCDRSNPTNCQALTKDIFINEHGNFESEAYTMDRDMLLYSAHVGATTYDYIISRLIFNDEPQKLRPVNFGGGYSNVIEKGETVTVEVPAPRIKMIEIRDYLKTFRRL